MRTGNHLERGESDPINAGAGGKVIPFFPRISM